MSQMRYLNTVLTVLAVLLGLHLYTAWAGDPPQLTAPAYAQEGGIPNAAAQRKEMIDTLKRMSAQVEEMKGLFANGRARVTVENAPDRK